MVGNYIVSFIGFLPADNPQVVVYVAIDYPKGVTQYGGTVAGGMEKEYQWYDLKYYEVPNVIGLDKKEANNLLKNFQIEYTGSGNKVISQSPESGERILEQSKVRILLDS